MSPDLKEPTVDCREKQLLFNFSLSLSSHQHLCLKENVQDQQLFALSVGRHLALVGHHLLPLHHHLHE